MIFKDISALVFDFDGVLTNNKVHIDDNGTESVTCNRSDGLAFDVLRKLNKPVYILSTEKSLVVTARAKKLRIVAVQGVDNKLHGIKKLAYEEGLDLNNILYVGNDLNDYKVMESCKYSACPSDSHKKIISISSLVLKSKGGDGVVRELLEDVFKLDFLKILYSGESDECNNNC
jgi:3-deoxy-D-manno-octulosonate 8-phosphate phosphatase (KDO 8-P phosphatase)